MTSTSPRFTITRSVDSAEWFSIFDRKTATDLSLTGEPLGSFTVSVHQEQTNGERVVDPADIIF